MKGFLDAVEARRLAEHEARLASTPPTALRTQRLPPPARPPDESTQSTRRRITTGVRNAIVRAAEQLRTTQSELARRLGISRRTVIRVLKAAGKSPGQGRALGVEAW